MSADPLPTNVQNLVSPLDDLRNKVTRALTDGSRRNPLIYYRDNRSSRFTIAPLGSPLMQRLSNGDVVRSAEFERDAVEQTGSAVATPLQQRLRKLKAKAREFEEEKGLRTLFVAAGMVSWKADDGGRDPIAPLFLVPVAIDEDQRSRGAFVVRRVDETEIVVNRALASAAPVALRELLVQLFEDGTVDDVAAAYGLVESALAELPAVTIAQTSALGIFNFSLMAMIEDLHQAGVALDAHPVIRALAGDPAAQALLVGERDGSVDVNDLDAIAPAAEPFVLDADPWQAQSIQTLLQFPQSHAVIDGPPGTGKSQTIGNLIAALIAQGRSVLFVCEKRAALDVVKRRLGAAGLGHLILDLHGADITRQKVYKQLKTSDAQMRRAPSPSSTYDLPLETTREQLNAHVRFMHTPREGCGLSAFELLNELAALPAFDLGLRIAPAALRAIDRVKFTHFEEKAREASRYPKSFLRAADVPWARAMTNDADVAAAVERVAAVPPVIDTLRAALRRANVEVTTCDALLATLDPLRKLRAALAFCNAGVVATLAPDTLALALRTIASPVSAVLQFFSPARRAAVTALRSYLIRPDIAPRACVDALTAVVGLGEPWRSNAAAVASFGTDVEAAIAGADATLRAAADALGATLPNDLDAARTWTATCAADRTAAYRAAAMRSIEAELVAGGLGELVAAFARLDPATWGQAIRYVWLQSHLEPLRPELVRFDGRRHDGVVVTFGELEAELRGVSRERVCRAAGERLIATANAHRDQEVKVRVELEKARPRKPLRSLISDAPDMTLALAPCVMASPLSISQFLPRATIFDVVIFDEGSQITPEQAVTAILRGHRVVIAGDDKQLPPTDFFGTRGSLDDDDDDTGDTEPMAMAGTESILGAFRPFGKPLGLRVHYRSRDERLIAFSNHHLYGDDLITFPGSGADDQGLRFVHVPPSGTETDEQSSSPEVARVVDLILEHAEHRPNESLGVIALGITHARRIETALAAARHARPELDPFFMETGEEPFFVKNLERVQGDERDAVILTIGYGRTKTGNVSHNFGPINQEGGERRLNVAITRAKSRLTLVASFRRADLSPDSLVSRGAKLLASYLGYAESRGVDLGRDGADPDVPPNAFERDIQQALEARLKTTIAPQYGVGRFRLDLAVPHPQEPGRFVLAVECDGATYHSTPTARMRDRLRQRVLEDLGWTFCRIWSTDWFNDREREIERVEEAYRRAVVAADVTKQRGAQAEIPVRAAEPPPITATMPEPAATRLPCPAKPPYRSITEVSDATLGALLAWNRSDGILRTDAELARLMAEQLGFQRIGNRIRERLEAALRSSRFP